MKHLTKTQVVNQGRVQFAQVFPSEKGRVLVQWTDGKRVVDGEGDTVMEAADRVTEKLSKG